ncbi:MAG: hypothetical protein FJW35_05320 [Acidobacteria bacterium]|nr:hypothetical protein [Acidobacteriota bacterium]
MTDEERVAFIRGHGYTERESAFLVLAALHSGHFLRRQYLTFTGGCKGRIDDLLVRKVIERRHGRGERTGSHTCLYHLCSRALYRLICESDNRNRRAKSPYAIKVKLMALGFVLEHPHYRFVATEHDKVAFFTGDLGLRKGRMGQMSCRFWSRLLQLGFPPGRNGTPSGF